VKLLLFLLTSYRSATHARTTGSSNHGETRESVNHLEFFNASVSGLLGEVDFVTANPAVV
jgi:hypothetical protein